MVPSSPSFFQVQLPKRITLTEEYEISLLEISYPSELHSFVTEKDSEIKIRFFDPLGEQQEVSFHLPQKCYYNIKEFLEVINDYISEYTSDITVNLNEETMIHVSALRSEIVFSPLIADILGLSTCVVERCSVYGKCAPNLFQQHNFLNVCVDVVKPMFFAKRPWSLLRRFQHEYKGVKYNLRTFEKPLYFPLARNEFDTISVYINTDHGNPISFDCGSVFLLLHLRKRSPR